ncbi:MAG: aminoacyl-tRNA hydrolase [Candidatus Adlerbacteria bacterium]|nr:aminoacyl-tRNA hydrolase [Candidatus Adlerbacteria bacterium]
MNWIIAGLGNPGKEYDGTRHNVGREFLQQIEKSAGGGSASGGKEIRKVELFGKKVTVVTPDTYMNNSGLAFKKLVTSKKQAEQFVVLQDELDLPLGKVKLSFGSSSGGHNGINSIHTALKTKDFVRIRIGISPATPSGKLKKPTGEEKVVDFVLGKFKATEQDKLKKAKKLVRDALELLVTEGREKATMEIHSRN